MSTEEPELPTASSDQRDGHVTAALYHVVKALELTNIPDPDTRNILEKLGAQLSSMTMTINRNIEDHAEFQKRLKRAEGKIADWQSKNSEMSDYYSPGRATEVLQAVHEIQKLIEHVEDSSLVELEEGRKLLNHAQCILQKGMDVLTAELVNILAHNTQFHEPEFPTTLPHLGELAGNSIIGEAILGSPGGGAALFAYTNVLVREDAVSDLRSIANIMLSSNYCQEFFQAFVHARKYALYKYLTITLQMKKISSEDAMKLVECRWESAFKKYLWAIRIIIRVYLVSEKRLCNQVTGEQSCSSTCFIEIAKPSWLELISYGEALATGPHRPEMLFCLLNAYAVVKDLLPDVDVLFAEEAASFMMNEVQKLLTVLGGSIKVCFATLKDFISSSKSAGPFRGGGVHHLTKYVMNFMVAVSAYEDTLNLLLQFEDEDCDSVSCKFKAVTDILELNLESKSKLYKDVSLQHIFLMNNIHYIVEKVRSCELRVTLGDEWIRSRIMKYQQHAQSYERWTWMPIISLIHHHRSPSPPSDKVLKQTCRNFNAAFEKAYARETAWVVPDGHLRQALQLTVSQQVVTAYWSFTSKLSSDIKDRYIKYTEHDLGNYISNLFEGSPRVLPL